MIVFLAGMQRSGSTFAFNVVRQVLKNRGTVYQEASPHALAVLDHAGDADHVILKAHDVDPMTIKLVRQGAIKSICTVRRVEDAIASWIETFGFDEGSSIDYMRHWFELYRQIRDFSLIVPYELIDLHPQKAARKIARYISPDVGFFEIRQIAQINDKRMVKDKAERLKIDDKGVVDVGFSHYDQETFFHRRHVSSLRSRPAEQRLTLDQVQRIRSALAPEIEELARFL